ncbi:MAG: agmatinase family protein [Bacteroidales bacterium]
MNSRASLREEKIQNFNPDGVGNTSANIFGLPFSVEESEVVVIPVPWDVTVSSGEGTSAGPMNVFKQSFQIDLFDERVTDPWKCGIAMETFPEELLKLNNKLREQSRKYIDFLEKNGGKTGNNQLMIQIRNMVNDAGSILCEQVKNRCRETIDQQQLPVILGGDHSTPLGLIYALGEKYADFGILQIDAHADLREAYEGFTHSHASVMFNALKKNQISKLVPVGLRDISPAEYQVIQENKEKIVPFFARDIHRQIFQGETWQSICENIIQPLPQNVYISFDVDGLNPSEALSTGTPVPGGLSFDKVLYLFEMLVLSGRRIIAFDLVETGAHKADGIVSCRLLYKTIALMLKSNKLTHH